MAPKEKDPADKKTVALRVLVTAGEAEQLQAAAKRADMSLSNWLRRLGLDAAASKRAARQK